MVIYLVRHGQTDWNIQKKLQGAEDIPLNEAGLRQTDACVRAFSGVPIDRVLTSPLMRARVLADRIAQAAGLSGATPEPKLTERDFGLLSGMTAPEREAFLARGEDPRMEPEQAMADRMAGVLRACLDDRRYKHTVIVSHGASIRALLAAVTGGTGDAAETIVQNAGITGLRRHGDTVRVDFFNLSPEEFSAMMKGAL